jgi:hypothetical protein
MGKPLLRTAIAAIAIGLSASFALSQTPIDPNKASEKNPNPASSSSSDDEGLNPLAREGEHSPTGHNPQPPTGPDQQQGTVGSGSSEGGGTGVADPLYRPQDKR